MVPNLQLVASAAPMLLGQESAQRHAALQRSAGIQQQQRQLGEVLALVLAGAWSAVDVDGEGKLQGGEGQLTLEPGRALGTGVPQRQRMSHPPCAAGCPPGCLCASASSATAPSLLSPPQLHALQRPCCHPPSVAPQKRG